MADDIRYLYDTATALSQGRRDLQEDAIATHFPAGGGLGYVVLADGMGGHAAGEVASGIVVRELSDELDSCAADPQGLERDIGTILGRALNRANGQVARYARHRPEMRGMGATAVATLIVANRLYWISVGDSPLYLLRGTRMSRLNQEHSFAQSMARMVKKGLLSQEEADTNPDRECLTSALSGAVIPEIDCRDHPLDLQDGDILIIASDGLQSIEDMTIATLVHGMRHRPSAEISARLLQEVQSRDDPEQDNVSLCVLKLRRQDASVVPFRSVPAAGPTLAGTIPVGTIQVAPPLAVTPLVAACEDDGANFGAARRSTLHVMLRRHGKRVSCSFSSEREG